MLSLNSVEVVYDGVILVLKGVSLAVGQGQITALLGANGAGKTTTLKAISGLLHAERGQVTKGAIELDGERLDRLAPHDIVGRGITQVFEGRRVFENLTVEENLVVGGHIQGSMQRVRQGIDLVFEYFPILRERRRQHAGYLSGGEQQMLAIGRALLTNPALLIMDEPSEGLAPTIIENLIEVFKRLEEEGLRILLIEQNLGVATALAKRQLIMIGGEIATETTAHALAGDSDLQRRYLGVEPLAR
jgi:branched-chain amino acid transport system ATP-binding protein